MRHIIKITKKKGSKYIHLKIIKISIYEPKMVNHKHHNTSKKYELLFGNIKQFITFIIN